MHSAPGRRKLRSPRAEKRSGAPSRRENQLPRAEKGFSAPGDGCFSLSVGGGRFSGGVPGTPGVAQKGFWAGVVDLVRGLKVDLVHRWCLRGTPPVIAAAKVRSEATGGV